MSKVKKISLIILIVSLIMLVAGFFACTYFIGSQIVASSTQLVTNEETKDNHLKFWQQTGFDGESFIKNHNIEKINIQSSLDGHNIPADFIYGDSKAGNLVIMAHGLGGNRYTNYELAQFFLENGYNVITYDQRSSGENTAEKTTFGYREKYDILDCIKYAKENISAPKIGIWGESFGGATAVQAVAHKETQNDISFLILDCPISNMGWMIGETMKEMDIPLPLDYLVWCGSVMNKIELGFSYKDADSSLVAEKINIPTLVINSKADTTTPYFMGKDIYDALASENKELWTSEDSKHVEMWRDYNNEYREKVLKLIA